MLSALLMLLAGAGLEGQIAYLSGSTQADRCVYVLDLASGTRTKVGTGRGDGAPVWSPDGRWLAFETRRGEGLGIFVYDMESGEGILLATSSPWNRDPAWNLESTMLAYSVSGGGDNESHIATYDLASDTESIWSPEGPGLRNPEWLPNLAAAAALASQEDFDVASRKALRETDSQDTGALLAIGLVREENRLTTDIFVVTRSEAFPIPQGLLPSKGVYAEWAVKLSRQGEALAFESNDGGDREIFILTDKGAYDATNHRSADWNPVWSPDGRWLAFESFRSGRRGIYRVHRDTNRVMAIAADEDWANWSPSWSPDGRALVHVSDRRGTPDLFVTEIGGGNSRAVVKETTAEFAPAWRPAR